MAQRVKNPAAVAWVAVQRFGFKPWPGTVLQKLRLGFNPWPWNFQMLQVWPLKKKKKSPDTMIRTFHGRKKSSSILQICSFRETVAASTS